MSAYSRLKELELKLLNKSIYLAIYKKTSHMRHVIKVGRSLDEVYE